MPHRTLSRRSFASALLLGAAASLPFANLARTAGAEEASAAEETATASAGNQLPTQSAPDYTDLANWAYWADEMTANSGGGTDGDADGAAEAVTAPGLGNDASTADKPVDLFIVCPTVSMGADGSPAMDLANATDRTSFVGALNMELGIYSDVCRVFAPFYRQATLAMYEASADKLVAAIDFAYADVAAAFERYLTEETERPFILAGFSQGSEHIIRLIKDYLGDSADQSDGSDDLSTRLVAAYAIGWRLTEEECTDFPWLQAAQGETDTGVVVTFNSEDPEVEDSIIVPAGTRTLAINPLSWSASSEEAPAELNLGACFTDYSGAVVEEVPEFCGAYLDTERGTLKVVGVDPADYPPSLSIFDEGVYHLYDYQFFYRNLQENVATRVEAYLDERAAATGLVTEQSRS